MTVRSSGTIRAWNYTLKDTGMERGTGAQVATEIGATPISTTTVANDGSVTFTGLEPGQRYTAIGSGVSIRFTAGRRQRVGAEG